MKHGRIGIFVLLLIVTVQTHASDTLLMLKVLTRIEQLQATTSDVFPQGSFPSYRTYALNKDRQKADINIFYTGLIAFTLRNIIPELTPHQQNIAQRIIDKTIPVANRFRNQKGRPTFNFWPTDDPQIFPNAGWMNWFDKQQSLPDDLDDTAIMLLALNAPDSTAQKVHAIMQDFTNQGSGNITNTFKDYQHIKAYSTWFGKKMPIDFDVCVLSNVLYMVQRYQLPWTAADSASLDLIVRVISNKQHLTDAAYVSPHYASPATILYHVSRLMQVRPIPALEALKPQMLAEAEDLMLRAKTFPEQTMLGTAMLKWGTSPPTVQPIPTNSLQELIEDEQFSFFIANMSSMLPNPLKNWAGKAGVGKFYYFCPAYNQLLVLEYLATTQRLDVNSR